MARCGFLYMYAVGVCWASWHCGLISFINFEKILNYYLFKYFSCPNLCLPFFPKCTVTHKLGHLLLFHKSQILCFFKKKKKKLPSLSVSVGIISIDCLQVHWSFVLFCPVWISPCLVLYISVLEFSFFKIVSIFKLKLPSIHVFTFLLGLYYQ